MRFAIRGFFLQLIPSYLLENGLFTIYLRVLGKDRDGKTFFALNFQVEISQGLDRTLNHRVFFRPFWHILKSLC